MTTVSGFSSRSSVTRIRQLPQRDDFAMTMDEPGWSNSAPADNAPDDVHPDVDPPAEVEPGFSNDKAVDSTGAKAVEQVGEGNPGDVNDEQAPAKADKPRKRG